MSEKIVSECARREGVDEQAAAARRERDHAVGRADAAELRARELEAHRAALSLQVADLKRRPEWTDVVFWTLVGSAITCSGVALYAGEGEAAFVCGAIGGVGLAAKWAW